MFYNRVDGTNALKLNNADLIDLNRKLEKKFKFNLKQKFYLKFDKEDLEELSRVQGGYDFNEFIRNENLTRKLLKFLDQIDKKHKTNFFKKKAPEERDLDCNVSEGIKLTDKLERLFKLFLSRENTFSKEEENSILNALNLCKKS